jgi:hypothetical protein
MDSWRKAAVPAAVATVGLALARLLADSAPPPSGGAAVMRPVRAGPTWEVALPDVQAPTAIPLAALVGGETADLGPDVGVRRARRPIPGTERAWREAFVAQLRQPDVDVDALVDSTIHGAGGDAEKVGLLRALLDTGSDKALDALVLAAEEAESHDGPNGAGVPEFCVRTLVERADRNADARAALSLLVARRDSSLEPRLRRNAAARVARTGTSSELALLAADIRGCGDPELLLGVAQSLRSNPEAAHARGFFSDLPAVPTDGDEL